MSDTLIANNAIKRLIGMFGREESGGQPIPGIINVGHSSYLSATLFALFACEEFRVNVILKSKENPDLIIYKLLSDIFLDMVYGEKKQITPQQFLEVMSAYRESVFEENEEYDPKLFLLELLDNLQESARSADRIGEALVFPTDVFFCQYQMRWQCRNRHISSKQENLFITSLSFPEGIYRSIFVSQMVDHYMRGDNTQNIDCERCKSMGGIMQSLLSSSMSMEKHCSILPNVLLLELPLFQQNVSLWSPKALIDEIIIVDNEEYSLHACICSDLRNPLKEFFVCYAMILEKWYYFNDEIVKEVSIPSDDHLKYAYILFYKKLSADYRYKYYDRVDTMIKTKSNSLPPKPIPKPQSVPSDSATGGEARRVGLRNQGYSCYMNSALQCLYHCSQFRAYVIGSTDSGTFHRLLKKLFTEMMQTSNTSIDPKDFYRQFISSYPQFTSTEEHDTQEFCTSLIARLNGEINAGSHETANLEVCATHTDAWTAYTQKYSNIDLVNIFGFLYVETKTCPTDHVWHKYNPSWILVVQLPNKTVKSQLNIQRIIEMSSTPEVIDVRCSECGDASVNAQLLTTLSRPPNILVIQLGIFSFDRNTLRPNKISLKINVNETIQVSGQTFSCRAMVCHKGRSIAKGHYYAFAKCGADWYQFNDSMVKLQSRGSIPNADVLFGVYLLFYEKT